MKITINKSKFEFVNKSFSNYHNWGHTTKLYLGNQLISKARAIYINRTWEVYQYQSVMHSAVHNLIEERLAEYISDYKSKNGIKRLIKSKREQLVVSFKKENKLYYKLLKKI